MARGLASQGGYVSYPELPDWSGPTVVAAAGAGLARAVGQGLQEIVVEQWIAITSVPARRPREPRCRSAGASPTWSALLDDPRHEVERVCAFVEIEAGEDVTLPMRALRDEPAIERGRRGGRIRSPSSCAEPDRGEERALALLAKPAQARPAASRRAADSPLRSVYTQSFPQLLASSSAARCWSPPTRPAS